MVRIFFGKGGLRRQRIAWYNIVVFAANPLDRICVTI